MGVSLSKGGNVSLTKMAPSLQAITVGLGWDVRTTTGADFDLDASALLLGADGRVIDDQHFVFFNNLRSPDGAVEHTGDNLTGEGEGDDESINVDLSTLSQNVERVVVAVGLCHRSIVTSPSSAYPVWLCDPPMVGGAGGGFAASSPPTMAAVRPGA